MSDLEYELDKLYDELDDKIYERKEQDFENFFDEFGYVLDYTVVIMDCGNIYFLTNDNIWYNYDWYLDNTAKEIEENLLISLDNGVLSTSSWSFSGEMYKVSPLGYEYYKKNLLLNDRGLPINDRELAEKMLSNKKFIEPFTIDDFKLCKNNLSFSG